MLKFILLTAFLCTGNIISIYTFFPTFVNRSTSMPLRLHTHSCTSKWV